MAHCQGVAAGCLGCPAIHRPEVVLQAEGTRRFVALHSLHVTVEGLLPVHHLHLHPCALLRTHHVNLQRESSVAIAVDQRSIHAEIGYAAVRTGLQVDAALYTAVFPVILSL